MQMGQVLMASTAACRSHFRSVSGFIPGARDSLDRLILRVMVLDQQEGFGFVSESYSFGMTATLPIRKVRTKPVDGSQPQDS